MRTNAAPFFRCNLTIDFAPRRWHHPTHKAPGGRRWRRPVVLAAAHRDLRADGSNLGTIRANKVNCGWPRPPPPHTHTPPSGSIKSTGLHSHWYFSVPAYSRWGGFVKTGLHTNISSVFKVCRWSFPEWRKRLMVPTSVLTQKPLMDWGQFHQAVQTCFPQCSNSPHGLWENVSPEAGSTQNHRSNWTAPVDCSPHQPPTHQHFPRS